MLQGDYVEKWYVKLLTVTSIKAVKCILPLIFDSPSYIIYRVSISSFPDYKHLLQENYAEYKHIFFFAITEVSV